MMFSRKNLAVWACATVLGGLAVTSVAQNINLEGTFPDSRVDVCDAELAIVSTESTDGAVDIEVEVNVLDCDGPCLGRIEYSLVLTDADGNNPVIWSMTDGWDWQTVKEPFSLEIHQNITPGLVFSEVRDMKISRCSCSKY